MLQRLTARALALSLVALPLFAQPLTATADSAAGRLFGLGPSEILTIDPATGTTAKLADLPQVNVFPGAFFNNLASDAAGHHLFTSRTYYGEDFTPHYQIVTVDTTSATTSLSGDMPSGVTFLLYDRSSASLFGQTNMCCPFQLVRIDPANGAQTHVADIPGIQPLGMAAAPDRHALYFPTEDFDPNTFQPIVTIVTVNTSTGALTQSPPIAKGIVGLVYDTISQTLLGKTFCCPASLVSVNPSTGAETTIADGLPIGPGLAIDSAAHTVYMADDELGAFDFFQLVISVNDQTGAVTTSTGELPRDMYVNSLAFESVVVTVAAVIHDVNTALTSGGISNRGVGASLLAELNAASAAASGGQCTAATGLMQAFINEVKAQTDNAISPETATKLIADAQSVTCP